MGNVVGIDLGGTNFRIALADGSGRIMKTVKARTNPSTLMSDIFMILDSFGKFGGIGIAWPGPVNARKGLIMKPPNNIGNRSIAAKLRRRYGVRVRVMNDCIAGALGEMVFGAGRRSDSVVYVTLSTGIGCGFISDGRLVIGKDGNGHEFGHVVVDTGGRMACACGGRGHWEAYCGGKYMGAFARSLLDKEFRNRTTALRKRRNSITAEMLFGMYRADGVAREIVNTVEKINALGIASIINAYDPEVVAIGGAIALNNPEILMKAIRRYTKSNALNRMPKITITPLGGDACLLGAIASVMEGPKAARFVKGQFHD